MNHTPICFGLVKHEFLNIIEPIRKSHVASVNIETCISMNKNQVDDFGVKLIYGQLGTVVSSY